MNDDYGGVWYAYENGETLGKIGPESGYILRDAELGEPDEPEEADARLTLEQGRVDNPGFFVSATLYGWLFFTTRRAAQTDAEAVYDAMQNDLSNLAALIPYEEDGAATVEQKAEQLTAAIVDFEQRYG